MQAVNSIDAPKAIGPYNQAIRSGNLLFCSGQTPVHPISMRIENNLIDSQTERAIQNMALVLAGAGLTISSIIKTTVYLTDMDNFEMMNAAYLKCFGTHKPARTTVAVKGLPLNALVEIECIAEFLAQ